MRTERLTPWLLAALALATTASAHSGRFPEAAGSLVAVSVEVGGHPTDLYPAPDGSGRYYLEAREGSSYLIRLTNRSAERVGVVLTVDGLNAISGQRDQGGGRMYILNPWGQATVQGWRSSLEEVRRFTFVDEEVSYAARTSQSNSRMGWIEVSVYREKKRWKRRHEPEAPVTLDRSGAASGRDEAASPAPEPTADAAESEGRATARSPARSYPGTGWGQRTHDPVVLVRFEPERSPCQRTTVRYEYRGALVALGVLPSPPVPVDRLAERDRGTGGFAPPPLW